MPPLPQGQVFKATYSGVPVYECLIKDVAVMRRRSDAWLNATQLLKVVGLDKSQRTRVLEKEIQKGVHEKVQGGYGKYQGTWIPMDVALALADHYNIRDLLEPITSFDPSRGSPPPAPKHAVASSGRVKKGEDIVEPARASSEESSVAVGGDEYARSEGSMSPSPSDVSSTSRTPSPIAPEMAQDSYPRYDAPPGAYMMARNGASPYPYRDYGHGTYEDDPQARYAEIILDYFISETTTIPPLLVNPPPDFDPNMSIDEDEHSALHWACAMGRIRVVKLLLSAGADVFRVNANGQTALMRAAMFSNNYDLRKFPELFELLHRSILNIDRNDRTVFHHVVDLALSRGKPHAARYYLETMINRLSEYGEQLADILNFQDDEGESALTMAARARSKRLVKLLLEHGADPKIRNKEGRNTEDYIVEDERFRASPSRAPAPESAPLAGRPHTSEAGQRAAGRSVALMSTLLHDLADSYDTELAVLDKKLSHAQSLLLQIQGEITDSGRTEASLAADSKNAQDGASRVAQLQKIFDHVTQARDADASVRDWESVRERIANTQQKQEPGDAQQHLLAPAQDGEAQRLHAEAVALKAQYDALKSEYATEVREQGTGHTMSTYRRLIAAGCGGIATEEVDAVVSVLSELLDQQGEAREVADRATEDIEMEDKLDTGADTASQPVAASGTGAPQ
ncbi:Transcription factor mbp1 (MBF subunit p120) [Malassezia cuniculi]|uniref:Transcription factor mbp1 (MBF subunit p120) n=1 Tax=Malassezia cuniculi TaxID=948313 RepID=A0AAF0ER52_9BASI|nr:Transcription factor mbp1 (MBF subunit p120) [Malassezia cuniculi]